MLFASLFDGALFDLLSPLDDALASSEVDVGRGEIVERLVIAVMIVVVDEALDGVLEMARQIVVFEQDAALQ